MNNNKQLSTPGWIPGSEIEAERIETARSNIKCAIRYLETSHNAEPTEFKKLILTHLRMAKRMVELIK